MKIDDELLQEGLRLYNRDQFAAQTGSVFYIRFSDATIEAVLTEVSPEVRKDAFVTFAMSFQIKKETALIAGTYRFDHPVIGDREILITPFEENGDQVVYQAIFNLMLPKGLA